MLNKQELVNLWVGFSTWCWLLLPASVFLYPILLIPTAFTLFTLFIANILLGVTLEKPRLICWREKILAFLGASVFSVLPVVGFS